MEQADVEQRGSGCQDGNVVGDHEVAHAEVVGVGDLATEYLPLVSHRPVQGVVEQDNDGVERHESQNTVGPERLAVIAGILLNSLRTALRVRAEALELSSAEAPRAEG